MVWFVNYFRDWFFDKFSDLDLCRTVEQFVKLVAEEFARRIVLEKAEPSTLRSIFLIG